MVYVPRTDLALEAREIWTQSGNKNLPDGVEEEKEDSDFCRITRVSILNEQAAQTFGKRPGKYITLSLEDSDLRSSQTFEGVAEALAKELRNALQLQPGQSVLVACLGNMNITPDAIGPMTAEHVIATRHLIRSMPEYFKDIRPVCVISPGVLGSTGLESGEILLGAAEKSGAERIIAIDALASRRLARVCSTIQITDTGIVPGSGVGNSRSAIDEESMGVKVIAVGVPTVVDAATLAADVMQEAGLGDPDASSLEQYSGGVIVTPRDIDAKIRSMSRLIGIGIDLALQEDMTIADISDLLSR